MEDVVIDGYNESNNIFSTDEIDEKSVNNPINNIEDAVAGCSHSDGYGDSYGDCYADSYRDDNADDKNGDGNCDSYSNTDYDVSENKNIGDSNGDNDVDVDKNNDNEEQMTFIQRLKLILPDFISVDLLLQDKQVTKEIILEMVSKLTKVEQVHIQMVCTLIQDPVRYMTLVQQVVVEFGESDELYINSNSSYAEYKIVSNNNNDNDNDKIQIMDQNSYYDNKNANDLYDQCFYGDDQGVKEGEGVYHDDIADWDADHKLDNDDDDYDNREAKYK